MLRSAICLIIISLITLNRGSVISTKGVELEGRITGGKNTTIENHPYLVSVRAFGEHFCGGSIGSKRVVITAAHCIHSYIPTSSYSVQYGTSVIGGRENIITAEHVLQHENFDFSNFNNDVALIFLVSDIPFSTVSKPIQLTSTVPAPGVTAVVIGWGALAENGVNAPTLQHVYVEIIKKSICEKQYEGINKITEQMLCAGVNGGGKDACQDDSGGPLVSTGKLVGIISYGMGCGRANYSGVYSNVAALENWIKLNMNE